MSLTKTIKNGIISMYEVEDDGVKELDAFKRTIENTDDREFTKVTVGRTTVYSDLSALNEAEKQMFANQVKAKKAALYNEAAKELDLTIETIKNSLQKKVDDAEKAVNQKYYAALRTPTADERAEIEHIVSIYNANPSVDSQRDIKFQNTRDFHLKNETTKAFVYCMASMEIYGEGKKTAMFDSHESGSENYDVMPDEWLQVVNPEVLTLKDEMQDVLEAKRLMQLYGYYQFIQIDKNRSNAYYDFKIKEFDSLDVISAKQMVKALGDNPNETRIRFS